ncbi:MAG: amino acid adenylation domain-containing protein, partial [Myxococcales bacterium]|nr:amino acid adenylation domain-containing protein [Myxococcales bacterium]
ERVEAAADRFGRNVAVQVPAGSCPAVTLTYAELDAKANRLAHRLLKEGLQPEGLVGVFLDRTADLVVGILAVLKAGGAYLPLDLSYPKERVAFILEDADSPLVLTTTNLQDDLPETGAKVLCLDEEAQALEVESSARPHLKIGPERLAYVIYTSGSTGAPKGVMVTHGNAVRLFDATEAWFGFDERDVWTLFHSHAFDFSVWELFGALIYGGRLVVVPYLVSRSPDAFHALLTQEAVTVLNQTPSSFRQLIRAEARAKEASQLSLRYVIFGGEALELAALAPWMDRHGDAAPRLINMYGITETTVHVTWRPITRADVDARKGSVIGVPIPDLELFVLDSAQGLLPPMIPGELYVAGAGLARGYLKREALTEERFATVDLGDGPRRLYRTGDRARRTLDGDVEYLGRVDLQVKLRGFRIELGEIESHLVNTQLVSEAVVLVREDEPGQPRLVAYVVPAAGAQVDVVALRAALAPLVPPYMVPGFFVVQDSLPLTRNGKVDRKALPPPTSARPDLAVAFVAPGTPMEQRLAALWRATLGLEVVGIDDNFFDLGGTSLLVADLREAVEAELGHPVEVVTFFQHPTVRALAKHLAEARGAAVFSDVEARAERARRQGGTGAVAIIGMAGRFPQADDITGFWQNLVEGRDCITHFTQEELRGTELDLERVFSQPGYVPARGVVKDAECFDAKFFGMNPREAALMDPQHRVWLEEAYHALEDAGCDPSTYTGKIGVFAGSFTNNHLLYNLAKDRAYVERYVRSRSADALQILVSNDKDFLASRVSYQLDLKGPAMAVQCGCSTSLVAAVKAYQSLLAHESDVVLAGGVCISQPQTRGYLYNEGGMTSADGACRAFDADASGTVFSNGAAVVVMKRLEDAVADGDVISAVIRGAALNNDGAVKMSYTAPSVDGQAEVIVAAQARAEVSPDSIGYIETHGTGTSLGDPIEVAGLTRAFRRQTDRKQYCGLGSVKTNVGHMDAAAGVTGLLKAALVLEREQIPPTVHFKKANPELHLEDSPFFVVDSLRPWPRGEAPRRAGVSAFGVGGTNAHVVLEEAPARQASGPSRAAQVILLSGRDALALDRQSERLAAHLTEHPEVPLADVAHTLRVGRRALPERQAVVATGAADAMQALLTRDPKRIVRGRPLGGAPQVVFMFPGQGAQHVDMGRALYEQEPVFRRHIDEVTEILQPILGLDLRKVMYPEGDPAEAARILKETGNTQPALFAIEYALARLWMSWGVEPTAMVGHSVGEYAAACLAEVFTVEDAATVLATRARLMQSMPGGAMRAVRMSEAELTPHLVDGVALAAVNAPGLSVVSGPYESIAAFDAEMSGAGLETIELHTSHAFHSTMMEPILAPFEAAVAAVRRRAPRRPFVSTLTGTWITDAEATDPAYWARQLRHTVRFSAALGTLFETPHRLLLEVGPSQNLSTSARQHRAPGRSFEVVPSLGGPRDTRPASEALLEAAGRLWIAGAPPDWAAFSAGERRNKVRLPGYPFERVKHWVEPPPLTAGGEAVAAQVQAALQEPTEAAPATPVDPGDRKDRIRAKLRELLLEL